MAKQRDKPKPLIKESKKVKAGEQLKKDSSTVKKRSIGGGTDHTGPRDKRK